MQSVLETYAKEYIWFQPNILERTFELRQNQEVVATLQFNALPMIAWEYTNRHPATLTSSHGQWNLSVQRKGFLGLAGTIRATGVKDVTLDAGILLLRGFLTFGDGRRLKWRGGLMRRSSVLFTDDVGMPVLHASQGDFFTRVNARVTISATDWPYPDLLLLAGLGLYMRLLMNKVNR